MQPSCSFHAFSSTLPILSGIMSGTLVLVLVDPMLGEGLPLACCLFRCKTPRYQIEPDLVKKETEICPQLTILHSPSPFLDMSFTYGMAWREWLLLPSQDQHAANERILRNC